MCDIEVYEVFFKHLDYPLPGGGRGERFQVGSLAVDPECRPVAEIGDYLHELLDAEGACPERTATLAVDMGAHEVRGTTGETITRFTIQEVGC